MKGSIVIIAALGVFSAYCYLGWAKAEERYNYLTAAYIVQITELSHDADHYKTTKLMMNCYGKLSGRRMEP